MNRDTFTFFALGALISWPQVKLKVTLMDPKRQSTSITLLHAMMPSGHIMMRV